MNLKFKIQINVLRMRAINPKCSHSQSCEQFDGLQDPRPSPPIEHMCSKVEAGDEWHFPCRKLRRLILSVPTRVDSWDVYTCTPEKLQEMFIHVLAILSTLSQYVIFLWMTKNLDIFKLHFDWQTSPSEPVCRRRSLASEKCWGTGTKARPKGRWDSAQAGGHFPMWLSLEGRSLFEEQKWSISSKLSLANWPTCLSWSAHITAMRAEKVIIMVISSSFRVLVFMQKASDLFVWLTIGSS